MYQLLLLVIALASATSTLSRIPRQVLITKFVKDVGATDPYAFIDVGRTRLKSWDVLTRAQLSELDTTDRDWFYAKTGINVSSGVEAFPGAGIFQGPTWAYFPVELESDQRLEWIVSDTHHPERTSPYRRHNWIMADGGNILVFTADGAFPGGEWQGRPFFNGGVVSSNFYIMVPNVTMSQWKREYELQRCRTDLQPGVGTPNLYEQVTSVFAFSCVGVRDRNSKSTFLVTNVYTNTSATSRDERKTQAWTWSW